MATKYETVSDIIAERDALRKDAERLNFLTAHPKAVSRSFGYLGSPDCWTARRGSSAQAQDFADLRDAIDAAMAVVPAVG